jgi:hypothetical protein
MERGTYSSEFTRMEDFEAKPLCDIERLSMSVGKKNVMLGKQMGSRGTDC